MYISLLTDGLFPFSIGGMQKHSSLLCRYLAKEGAKVDVYHPHTSVPRGSLIEKLGLEPSWEVEFLPVSFPSFFHWPGHYFAESFSHSKSIINKYINRIRETDFVYAQGFTAWAYLKARKMDSSLPPVIINFHGLEMYQMAFGVKQKFIYQAYKPFVRKNVQEADYVQSLGGKLTPILQELGIKNEQILSLPIGIPESWVVSQVATPQQVRRFVFVGRYERRKGTEELIKALGQLTENEMFTFDFIGNIPEDKRIQSPNITYWGMVKEEENIKRLLTEADVLICPSYAEGMPTVILEGMARGCAIIATDVGAVAEVVDDAVGWLLEAGNVPLLASTIKEAIHMDTAPLQQKQVNALSRVAEKFTWEKVIDRMMKRFRGIIPSVAPANMSK